MVHNVKLQVYTCQFTMYIYKYELKGLLGIIINTYCLISFLTLRICHLDFTMGSQCFLLQGSYQ